MVSARDRLLAAWRARIDPDFRDIVETIETEAELASFHAGLRLRGALTTDAMTAIEQRRFQLQRAKGVTWRT